MDRLQNAVPVARGPGFLQLSVQLQGVLQPKTPSQKALYHNIKRDAKTVSDFLRPLLGRNQYCNEGCKKRATVGRTNSRCWFLPEIHVDDVLDSILLEITRTENEYHLFTVVSSDSHGSYM